MCNTWAIYTLHNYSILQSKCTHSKLNQFVNGFCAVYPCSITAQGFITNQKYLCYVFHFWNSSHWPVSNFVCISATEIIERLKNLIFYRLNTGFCLGRRCTHISRSSQVLVQNMFMVSTRKCGKNIGQSANDPSVLSQYWN